MAERDKLPAKITAERAVQVLGQPGSLVARGLEAIERRRSLPPEAIEPKAPQLADDARQIARRCATIAELEEAVRAFDGCALKRNAQNTVFAAGVPGAPVMIVDVAPGAASDRLGKPLAGVAGQLMDRMFDAIGMSRERDLYITNIFFWRWPADREPTFDEQAMCLALTRRHIELAKPKVLVLLGGITTKPLLNITEGFMRLRGKWTALKLDDGTEVPTMPTFHPAFLLRTPGSKRHSWLDLLAIDKKIRELGVRLGETATTPSVLASDFRPGNSAAEITQLHRAAEQGDAWGQYMLGEAYHEGDGVAQNEARAFTWWLQAAMQGLNEAQYRLGCSFSRGFYHYGKGKDYVKAYMWFRLGATWESKNDFSKSAYAAKILFSPTAEEQCLLIGRQMTQTQISDAQRFAREWKEYRAS